MWENRKKIGIMGGTFDPIHIGHLILGEIAYEQFQLDKVLFMPAGNPPHKKNRKDGASNQQRVEMVKEPLHQILILNYPWWKWTKPLIPILTKRWRN